MRVLLIGETGLGKTVTALTLSQFFNTVYYDTEEGTLLWIKHFKFDKSKFKLYVLNNWHNDFIRNIATADLVVLDSLSTLMEHYHDFLQSYVRERKEFPMPTATGVVRIKYDTDFIVLPMQLYQLLYDTMLNVVDTIAKRSNNCIITMHPIETRQLAIDGTVIQSHGRHKFIQGIFRRMDIILQFTKPMQAKVVKARGIVEVAESVNPIEFLKEIMGVKE